MVDREFCGILFEVCLEPGSFSNLEYIVCRFPRQILYSIHNLFQALGHLVVMAVARGVVVADADTPDDTDLVDTEVTLKCRKEILLVLPAQ